MSAGELAFHKIYLAQRRASFLRPKTKTKRDGKLPIARR
jgi:hypothetical protein